MDRTMNVSNLSARDRIEKAKEVIEKLTYRIREVIELQETNELVFYGDVLSKQIPVSYAASAFNNMQQSLLRYQVIRLLAIWDKNDDNAISIPRAVKLINCQDVIDLIARDTKELHATSRPFVSGYDDLNDDDIDEMVQASQLQFGVEQAENAQQYLKETIEGVTNAISDDVAKGLRNARDHLSHSLSETRGEIRAKKSGIAVPKARLGQEKDLLEKTIKIIEELYVWVNGVSYDIQNEVTEDAKKCAEQFWRNLTFTLPQSNS